MTKKDNPFTKGKWIIHTYYGVGQIKGVEKKQIGDEKIRYLKVKTKNSTFFVPADNIDKDRIRPISSEYKIRKAVKILKEPAQEMDEDHNQRKRQLGEQLTDNSIENMAELIRDLTNRRVNKGLNDHEQRTLEKLMGRMTLEWSLVKGVNLEDAQEKLESTVKENLIIIEK